MAVTLAQVMAIGEQYERLADRKFLQETSDVLNSLGEAEARRQAWADVDSRAGEAS